MVRYLLIAALIAVISVAILVKQSPDTTIADPGTPLPSPTATKRLPSPTATPRPAATSTPAKITQSTAPLNVVLIVLDGARPDYFTVPNIPHVKALIQNGTQYSNAFAGILESETPSGHATIATGSQPTHDGILSFSWANSENSSVDLFNEATVRAGVMERVMRQAGAPTIAGEVHRQNAKATVVALSGYKYYAADAIGGPNADVIMYFTNRPNGKFGPTAVPGHVPPAGILNAPGLTIANRSYPLGVGDHLAMQLASETYKRMQQKVTLINLPEFDWPLGHVDGASRDQKDLRTLMQDFDRDLAMLEQTYQQAGTLSRTVFVLTADHGFAPIDHKVSHVIMNDAVAAAGTSIIRDTYHTAGYAWIRDESKAAAAAANVARKQNPYVQSVYFRSVGSKGPVYIRASGADQFRASGVEQANQYLLNTFNGPDGPDLVVFMKEHAMLVSGGESTWKGDHGGSAWQSQHVPLILSGPGVRKGYTSIYPATLMDVAPTVLTLLQAPTTGMQGIPLADAMIGSTAAQQSQQQAQGTIVWPVVNALTAESSKELAAGQ
jgi:hypothetical protein